MFRVSTSHFQANYSQYNRRNMSRLYRERNKISCEVVANDGYFINLDSTRNMMHIPTIKINMNVEEIGLVGRDWSRGRLGDPDPDPGRCCVATSSRMGVPPERRQV
jgi:hypothetical protein